MQLITELHSCWFCLVPYIPRLNPHTSKSSCSLSLLSHCFTKLLSESVIYPTKRLFSTWVRTGLHLSPHCPESLKSHSHPFFPFFPFARAPIFSPCPLRPYVPLSSRPHKRHTTFLVRSFIYGFAFDACPHSPHRHRPHFFSYPSLNFPIPRRPFLIQPTPRRKARGEVDGVPKLTPEALFYDGDQTPRLDSAQPRQRGKKGKTSFLPRFF